MPIDLIIAREMRRRGESTRGLELGTRSGLFVRVRPGVYAVAAEWRDADPRSRHRAAMDALIATGGPPRVFSHESAALLQGIPLIGHWPPSPHVLEVRDASRRAPAGTIVHLPMRLPDIERVGAFSATTPGRTALDLASSRSLATGVGAFDHVLRRTQNKGELENMIVDSRPFHGVRRAMLALSIATGLSESPLESLSLARIHEAGFPAPVQQVSIEARGSRYRLDFFWPEWGVVGEADGRLKYRTPADLWSEKRREDDLRSLGLGIARWNWDDAWVSVPLIRALSGAGLPLSPRNASSYSSFAADGYA
jgi:hypothetical protein